MNLSEYLLNEAKGNSEKTNQGLPVQQYEMLQKVFSKIKDIVKEIFF